MRIYILIVIVSKRLFILLLYRVFDIVFVAIICNLHDRTHHTFKKVIFIMKFRIMYAV